MPTHPRKQSRSLPVQVPTRHTCVSTRPSSAVSWLVVYCAFSDRTAVMIPANIYQLVRRGLLLSHQHFCLAERECSWHCQNARSPDLPLRFGCYRHDRSRSLYWKFHVHQLGCPPSSYLCSLDVETLAAYLLWQPRWCAVRYLHHCWIRWCLVGSNKPQRTSHYCNDQGCNTYVASDLLEGNWC